MKKLLSLLYISLLFVIGCSAPYTLTSKESDLRLSLRAEHGELWVDIYGSDDDQESLILSTLVQLEINELPTLIELTCSAKSKNKECISMPYGEFSQVNVSYSDLVCDTKLTTASDISYDATLTLRLFESAFAYRIEVKGLPEATTIQETGRWTPSKLDGFCYSTNGEREPLGGLKIAEARKMHRTPFIYDDGERIFALHECDLVDYPQLVIQGHEQGSSLTNKSSKAVVSGNVSLPWRVVMVGEEFEDLHNQKPIYQALSRPAEGDYSWVKPGTSMWDWRVKGCTFDGFTYDMSTATMKRYIDFCSASNLEYLLIDDEWFTHENPLKPVEALDIKEVVRYGNEKGVGIILYYDMVYVKRHGVAPIDFETVAQTYADFGVAGMKYGFLSSANLQEKTRMTHNIITTLAKHKLIVDFHDNPIPFSGMERTYPNYITREYCHAQLDRRTAFTPRQFVKMACINLLAGHMDQTNGTFALNEMSSRAKGPRNEYQSTVAGEVARFVVTHTGSMSVLLDAPEAYAQKADLFHVISTIPSVWDETIYIGMDYESHVAVAKRSKERWYIAVVYNEKGGEHELDLEFLDKGAKYKATIYRDAPDTDYINNKEAYLIESRTVSSEDEIEIEVPAGGGFTIIFEKC